MRTPGNPRVGDSTFAGRCQSQVATSSGSGTIYYAGSDNNVHQMSWGGSKWLDANLMASSGSGMTVSAGTSPNADTGGDIWYVGADQRIHQMFWGGGKWLDANLMSSSQSGMTAMAGTTPAADASGNVWYVGSDQCLHKMYSSGSQWMDVNWTAGAGTGTLVAPGTTVTTNNAGVVYLVGTDQRVHQMFASGGSYADVNLMSSSGSGMTVLPGTSPTADTGGHIWYAGADQCVHQLSWGGSKWVDSNWMAGSATGLLTAQGTSLSTNNASVLYYIDGIQNVHQLYWGGSQYANANLMVSSGSGLTAFVPRTAMVQNLTNPTWGASFNVGDTMSVTVKGPVNLAVTLSQSPGGTSKMGSTNANGIFTYSAVEKTANIGSYTQVWTVGTTAASPSLSYLVGQLGNPGTISSNSTVQSEGDYVTGISTLSITNGYINTYSTTELNNSAKLYYDSGTVGTLFDNGTQISQQTSPTVDGNSFTMMSGNGNAWDDYDLQTDHYVYAFEASGVYYNPLYFGQGGCDGNDDEDGSDCTLGSGSEGYYQLAEASLYLGSTVADQSYVPQNGSLPLFNLNYLNAFAAASSQPVAPLQNQVSGWVTKMATVYASIRLLEGIHDPSPATNPSYIPIPFYVDLQTDYYNIGNGQRQRTFIIRDLYGSPWKMTFPLRVRERFSNMVTSVGGTSPTPNGIWYNLVPITSPQDVVIRDSDFTDLHQGTILSSLGQSSYIQYYYATDFTVPQYLAPLLNLLSAPGVSPSLGPALPLWIKDTLNKCSPTPYVPGEAIILYPSYVSIDGDKGTTQAGCEP